MMLTIIITIKIRKTHVFPFGVLPAPSNCARLGWDRLCSMVNSVFKSCSACLGPFSIAILRTTG